jgi:hypothetical protein
MLRKLSEEAMSANFRISGRVTDEKLAKVSD